MSIDRNRTGVSINDRMDMLIPASKISNQNTGNMKGVWFHEAMEDYGKYDSNMFRCRISVDIRSVKQEQSVYRDLSRCHSFGTPGGEGEVPHGEPEKGCTVRWSGKY